MAKLSSGSVGEGAVVDQAENSGACVVVIGGGISGMSCALRLAQSVPAATVVLLERDDRLGGKIMTEHCVGFVIEGGPEALHIGKPEALTLCQELGLEDRLIGTNPVARRTYILRSGQLGLLPDGMASMMPTKLGPIARSQLISPLGKMRMGLEFFVPPRRSDDDEAVATYFERRLGREAYRWLIDPLVGAIYGGDGHRLSLNATFPQIRRQEQVHGGLIRGAFAAKRSARQTPKADNRSPMVTPRFGLGELAGALSQALLAAGVRALTDTAVSGVSLSSRGYSVMCADGRTLPADAVVCAAPAPIAGSLLRPLDSTLAADIGAISHASTATVVLAYRSGAIPRPLDASGYVAPRTGGRAISACTWVSAKWSGRAPEGMGLFRLSFGGCPGVNALARDDNALVAIARAELRTVLGITASPILSRLFRWPDAMPQYEVGHLERIAAIETRLADHHPGLALAGNAYRGIGLADCVRSGEDASRRIVSFLADRALAR